MGNKKISVSEQTYKRLKKLKRDTGAKHFTNLLDAILDVLNESGGGGISNK